MARDRVDVVGGLPRPFPTLDKLVEHVQTVGLDREKHRTRRQGVYVWEQKDYKRWSSLRKDTAVELALMVFSLEEFQSFVVRIGYPQWRGAAGREWLALHGRTPPRDQGRQGEKEGGPLS